MSNNSKVKVEYPPEYRLLEVKAAFKTFMDLLQNDIKTLFDGEGEIETPFIVKVDVNLGVRQEDDEKSKKYHPRLTEILNSLPNRATPVKKKEFTAQGPEEVGSE
jgi:hypothetical protein